MLTAFLWFFFFFLSFVFVCVIFYRLNSYNFEIKYKYRGIICSTACSEDWLEIYVIFRDGNDRFLGRYCSNTAPGPVESPRGATGVRLHMHTDAENVSSGFKGRYVFEVAKSVTGLYPITI